MTGSMIEFQRPDGASCPGYLAEASPDAPGLVVIQEWWGLNEQIKKTADRFAQAGFRALVPDLYRGEIAGDADEANHKMNNLDWGAAAQQDLKGALQHLKQNGKSAGVVGFCMGGALTIISAVHLEEVTAAVCFYGIPPQEAADPANIKIPMMFHFASNDDWCNADAVAGLEKRLIEGNVSHELYLYGDTQHAFFNDARPEVHDAEASKLAFDRSSSFLLARLR